MMLLVLLTRATLPVLKCMEEWFVNVRINTLGTLFGSWCDFLFVCFILILRQEVHHMRKELLREQTRCKVLEEELENPLNVHRWRKLEVMSQHQVPKARISKSVTQHKAYLLYCYANYVEGQAG